MKTKLKDIILYSLAIVGAVSLFINATNPQPAPPKYDLVASDDSTAYLLNKETGDVWGLKRTGSLGQFSRKATKIEIEK